MARVFLQRQFPVETSERGKKNHKTPKLMMAGKYVKGSSDRKVWMELYRLQRGHNVNSFPLSVISRCIPTPPPRACPSLLAELHKLQLIIGNNFNAQ